MIWLLFLRNLAVVFGGACAVAGFILALQVPVLGEIIIITFTVGIVLFIIIVAWGVAEEQEADRLKKNLPKSTVNQPTKGTK
jgi:NADH:ubiquinone oxidoreductase subunit 6 (subunit J)